MKEIIGEQKVAMNSLMLLLRNYQKETNIAKLIADLEEIQELYKQVKITYEYLDPTSEVVDGVLTVKQNDKQIIDMPEEILTEIIEKVQNLRNSLLQL
jgi:nitrogenase molybdenum-iron protein alpha/beta subunit